MSFPSCTNGVQDKSIEISIRIIGNPQRFLDYNMELDGQGLTVNDPESHGLRALRLGKGNDDVRRLRIVGPINVCFGQIGRSMGMGVDDCHEYLTRSAKVPKRSDQLL